MHTVAVSDFLELKMIEVTIKFCDSVTEMRLMQQISIFFLVTASAEELKGRNILTDKLCSLGLTEVGRSTDYSLLEDFL